MGVPHEFGADFGERKFIVKNRAGGNASEFLLGNGEPISAIEVGVRTFVGTALAALDAG